MILVDSSAWIELLRNTGHGSHRTLRRHIEAGSSLATTELVVMELVAGARTDRGRDRLRERLLALPVLRLRGMADVESAAELCRRWPQPR